MRALQKSEFQEILQAVRGSYYDSLRNRWQKVLQEAMNSLVGVMKNAPTAQIKLEAVKVAFGIEEKMGSIKLMQDMLETLDSSNALPEGRKNDEKEDGKTIEVPKQK